MKLHITNAVKLLKFLSVQPWSTDFKAVSQFAPVSLSQTNIEPCPECGHLKQKHILCGFCYSKVCKETSRIRQQINAMEGGPLRAPTVETVVLYEGETASQQDKDKRIVERARKRPAWFSLWCWDIQPVWDTNLQSDAGLVRYTLMFFSFL